MEEAGGGGGGAGAGRTITSVETDGGGGGISGVGRTITSVETAGGGGGISGVGRTITSVEQAGGGGNDNGRTISPSGPSDGILRVTATVSVTAAAGIVTPAPRWQGAAAGVAVGMLGLL